MLEYEEHMHTVKYNQKILFFEFYKLLFDRVKNRIEQKLN